MKKGRKKHQIIVLFTRPPWKNFICKILKEFQHVSTATFDSGSWDAKRCWCKPTWNNKKVKSRGLQLERFPLTMEYYFRPMFHAMHLVSKPSINMIIHVQASSRRLTQGIFLFKQNRFFQSSSTSTFHVNVPHCTFPSFSIVSMAFPGFQGFCCHWFSMVQHISSSLSLGDPPRSAAPRRISVPCVPCAVPWLASSASLLRPTWQIWSRGYKICISICVYIYIW